MPKKNDLTGVNLRKYENMWTYYGSCPHCNKRSDVYDNAVDEADEIGYCKECDLSWHIRPEPSGIVEDGGDKLYQIWNIEFGF